MLVLAGDVIDEPVLGDLQGPFGQVLAGAADLQVVDELVEAVEEGRVQPLVRLQPGEGVPAHQGFLCLEVLYRIVPKEGDRLLDTVLALAVEDAVMEAMGGLEKPPVLLIDLGDADAVGIRPVLEHVSPSVGALRGALCQGGMGGGGDRGRSP